MAVLCQFLTLFSVVLKVKNEIAGIQMITVSNVLLYSLIDMKCLTNLNYKIEFNRMVGKLKSNGVVIGVADISINGICAIRQPGMINQHYSSRYRLKEEKSL